MGVGEPRLWSRSIPQVRKGPSMQLEKQLHCRQPFGAVFMVLRERNSRDTRLHHGAFGTQLTP